ncbi:MAG: hypothetical protein PVF85_09765, partial [Anaerolineales bacterium]
MSSQIVDLSAHEQVRSIRAGELSAVELLDETYRRIEAVEGRPPTTAPYLLDAMDLEKVHAFITRT